MEVDQKSRGAIGAEAEGTKEALDAQLRAQDQHSKDTDITERGVSGLHSAGTTEGHQARVTAIAGTESSIKAEAEKLEQKERAISEQGEKVEGEIKGTADVATQDSRTAHESSGQVKFEGAKRGLKAAADASKGDAQFLEKVRKEREGTRSAADTKTAAFSQNIKRRNIKLKG